MDKKTSISTVILVLLVLLTLVSLSASAYLYFTYNPLTAKENSNPEECVDEDPYKGWTLYSDDKNSPSVLFYYPKDWKVETAIEMSFGKTALPQTHWISGVLPESYEYIKISPSIADTSSFVLVTRMDKINDSEFDLTDYVSNLVKEDAKIGYTSYPLECSNTSCPVLGFSTSVLKVIDCTFNSDTENGPYGIRYFISGDSYFYSVSYTLGSEDDDITELIMDSMSFN